MGYPTLIFNSATGSDTAASGAGPATPLSGTGAVTTGSTTVDLSADSPDLSGVATDGTAVLWVDTTSGRKFAKISAVNDSIKTVTVELTYATSESGRNWGIGGKRATFAGSAQAFADHSMSWIFETETDQNLTAAISLNGVFATVAAQNVVIRGSSGSLKVITQTTSSLAAFTRDAANWYRFENLQFLHSGATRGSAIEEKNLNGWLVLNRCLFGGHATNNPVYAYRRVSGYGSFTAIGCVFDSCSGVCYDIWNQIEMQDCLVINTVGIALHTKNNVITILNRCAFVNCGSFGAMYVTNNMWTRVIIQDCVLHGGTSANLFVQPRNLIVMKNTHITGCPGTALQYAGPLEASADTMQIFESNNWYGNSANLNYGAIGATDTQVDPDYVDAGNGDITPQKTSFLTGGVPAAWFGYGFNLNRSVGAVNGGGASGGLSCSPFRSTAFV